MKTTERKPSEPATTVTRQYPHNMIRKITGGFFLFTGGIHVGIVMTNPQIYAPFAQEALVSFVARGWDEIFMASPVVWGSALATAEVILGVFLFLGGRWAKAGWLGVIAFHLGLMLFGWGFWLWSIPFLAAVGPTAWHDLRSAIPARPAQRHPVGHPR